MRDWDKFMVRLPPGFRDQIKVLLAKENGRSMNAEIVQRLKEVLKMKGSWPDARRIRPKRLQPPRPRM